MRIKKSYDVSSQSKCGSHYSVCCRSLEAFNFVKEIFLTVLLSFFSVFIFSMPFESDNNSNKVFVLGHKYIFGPSQRSFNFNPIVTARSKMS